MSADDCQKHISGVFYGKETQFVIFHRKSHVLHGHFRDRAGPEIKNEPQQKIQIHEADEDDSKTDEGWTNRFLPGPSRGGFEKCDHSRKQNEPAQETVKSEELWVKILQHLEVSSPDRRLEVQSRWRSVVETDRYCVGAPAFIHAAMTARS